MCMNAKLQLFYPSKLDSLLFSHFAVLAVEGDELSFSSWTQIPEYIIGRVKLQPLVRIIEAIYKPPPRFTDLAI